MLFPLDNADTQAVIRCQPIAVVVSSSDATLGVGVLANNQLGPARYRVLGLVFVGAASGASMQIQTEGRFQATTTEWDLVTGQSGGLTPAAAYYLGPRGTLTRDAPSSAGEVETFVGVAMSTTKLNLRIKEPVLMADVQDKALRELVEQLLLQSIQTNNLLRLLVAGMGAGDAAADTEQERVQ